MSALSLSVPLVGRLVRSDYRVVITGASGWLGQASFEMLSGAYGKQFNERVKCFGSLARTLRIRGGQLIDQRPLPEMQALDNHPTILLHFAYLTKEKAASMSLDEYVATNRTISRSTYQAAKGIGVDRIFLVSSGAVYQAMAAAPLLQPVQPYGALKLEDEALFSRFAHESEGARVITARLFNVSGPYINKLGSYALASFIEQARQRHLGACIKINADHPVIRSYIAVENLVRVALSHLLDDATDPYVCFDTAGDREVEVQELAETVRYLVNPDITISRPALTSVVADRYVGDGTMYRSLAARHGVVLHDLEQQVRDTASYLNEASLQ
jgi:nucleoside-diphosphate-sugar epimerase